MFRLSLYLKNATFVYAAKVYCLNILILQDHIYQLMKNDSYNRYLRSDMYKEFLGGTKKKVKKLLLMKFVLKNRKSL